jgi:hypothetical protein
MCKYHTMMQKIPQVKHHGFAHFSVRDYLTRVIEERKMPVNRYSCCSNLSARVHLHTRQICMVFVQFYYSATTINSINIALTTIGIA